MRRYTVMLHEAEEGGYWVEVPSLPGCFSQGETVEEAMRQIRKAVRSHIQALRQEGLTIPEEDDYLLAHVDVSV